MCDPKVINSSLNSVNNSLSTLNSHWFHSTIQNMQSGYRAIQVIFNGSGINPILYTDADGNAFIINGNWQNVPTTPTPAESSNFGITWIKNNNTINVVWIGSHDAYGTNQRVKLTYNLGPVAGAWLSLDGNVKFIGQQFVNT